MSKKALLWTVSTVIAAALTASGMHAHQNSSAGLYRQMPGVVLGLLSGFVLDSPIVVVGVTVAANACFYYLMLSSFLWVWGRLFRAKSN